MNNQKKLGVGVIIQNQDGDFLLHLRDEHTTSMPNQWSLIGGGIELNETTEQAAIREVKEETSLSPKNLSLVKTIIFDDTWDAAIFCAQVDTNKQKMTLHEGKKLTFFHREDAIDFINQLPYSNPFLEATKEYLAT